MDITITKEFMYLGFGNDVLGVSYHSTEGRGEVLRICKTNGMRLDLVILAECAEGISMLPHTNISEELRKIPTFIDMVMRKN